MLDRRQKVLVVEDEGEIRQLMVIHLKREGFEVDEASNGEEATQYLARNQYSLVILDWMLPAMSGLEITRWIRSRKQMDRTPILFVTAKTEPEHIASALDAGADDYVSKPFDTLVLMARVNALLRRHQWLEEGRFNSAKTSSEKELMVGAVILNQEAFEAFVEGKKLDLTRSEFKLLECLMLHQGKVLSRERLIEEIQGDGVNVVGRTVDTHVFGLRKKLGLHADLIETIRGVGYRVRYIHG